MDTASEGHGNHYRISPTARIVAYCRSFSDIPYATETAKAVGAEEVARAIYHDDCDLVTRLFGPLIEARYKCFNRALAAHSNVLELAVGTSIERGLSICDAPDRIYVGTDLPEMIRECNALLAKTSPITRTNHHLEVANVLSYEELDAAVSHFRARPELLIINEGLWMYLTRQEQFICAENIRRILERHGGRWVTPDIGDLETREQRLSTMGSEMQSMLARVLQKTAQLTGKEVEKSLFANRSEAIKFFSESGFEVNYYPVVDDLGSLSSLGKLWGERERAMCGPWLRQHLVWVMSLR
jgi:hypothetical protein